MKAHLLISYLIFSCYLVSSIGGTDSNVLFSAIGANLLVNPSSSQDQVEAYLASILNYTQQTPPPPGAYLPPQVEPPLVSPPNVTVEPRDSAAFVNWDTKFSIPSDCFDPVRGIFKAPSAGYYRISAQFGMYSPFRQLFVNIVPNVLLVKYTPSLNQSLLLQLYILPDQIAKDANWGNIPPQNRPLYQLDQSFSGNFNTINYLNKNDEIRLYYSDSTDYPTLAATAFFPPNPYGGYSLTPLRVDFSVDLIPS